MWQCDIDQTIWHLICVLHKAIMSFIHLSHTCKWCKPSTRPVRAETIIDSGHYDVTTILVSKWKSLLSVLLPQSHKVIGDIVLSLVRSGGIWIHWPFFILDCLELQTVNVPLPTSQTRIMQHWPSKELILQYYPVNERLNRTWLMDSTG